MTETPRRYRLPFDYARCLSDACPRRESCLRWLTRDDDAGRPLSFCTFPGDRGGPCPDYLPADERQAAGLAVASHGKGLLRRR